LHVPEVAAVLRQAVDQGRLGAFGASVYEPDAAARALAVSGVTLLQAPLNVFDRRLAESGALERAAAGGVAVFARSVYLQGLLLSDPERLPAFFEPAAPALRRFQAIARAARMSPAALALAAVLAEDGVASVVIGVANADEPRANAQAAAQSIDPAAIAEARTAGQGLPLAMIDPRQWPT
jgi:aryl-alcohol dehydrogenase-like predicted oxidoreductase